MRGIPTEAELITYWETSLIISEMNIKRVLSFSESFQRNWD